MKQTNSYSKPKLILGQNGAGSDANKGVLHILQSSSITGTSPSDCLVSYTGQSLGKGLTPLQRSSQSILQSQLTGQVIFCNESRIYIGQVDDTGTFLRCCSYETFKDDCLKKTSQIPQVIHDIEVECHSKD